MNQDDDINEGIEKNDNEESNIVIRSQNKLTKVGMDNSETKCVDSEMKSTMKIDMYDCCEQSRLI